MSMEVSKAQDGTALIDGMPIDEHSHMIDTREGFEEYVAQKCPASYVIGLEIGTMWARTKGLKSIELHDYSAWSRQEEGLEAASRALWSEENVWSSVACEYGKAAGIVQPLEDFEVQGVTA